MEQSSGLSLEEVAKLSSEELDRLLGDAVLEDAFLSKIPSRDEIIAAGRVFFERSLPTLRERLCGNSAVAGLLAAEHKERNTIIAAIAELIPDLSKLPLVLAASVLHYGYDRLCPAIHP